MTEQVYEILKQKGFSELLIKYAIELLPEMIKLFGKEKIIKFFKEYTFFPRERDNGPNSGGTYREEKRLEFNWGAKDLHNALILYIHEAGHAIGVLKTNEDSFLMEGFKYKESFLTKLEEAIVSEKQDDLEFGELNYCYHNTNNYENGEDTHKNDFKTQPSHHYTINKVYLKNIQLLLGNNRNLINEMMYADSLEEKTIICNRIIKLLKEQLTENEFLILKDCITVMVLNYSYKEEKDTLFSSINKDDKIEDSKKMEAYKEVLKEYYPQNGKYCLERNLINKNIFDAVDDLCELTIDVLYRRISNPADNSFSTIKESCEYFSKVYNNNEKLAVKTNQLKNILFDRIKKLIPSIVLELKNKGISDEDIFEFLTKIIATSDFNESDLDNIKIINNEKIGISVLDKHEYVIEKEPVYSSDDDYIWFEEEPIGYKNVLKEEKQKQTEISKKNSI